MEYPYRVDLGAAGAAEVSIVDFTLTVDTDHVNVTLDMSPNSPHDPDDESWVVDETQLVEAFAGVLVAGAAAALAAPERSHVTRLPGVLLPGGREVEPDLAPATPPTVPPARPPTRLRLLPAQQCSSCTRVTRCHVFYLPTLFALCLDCIEDLARAWRFGQ